MRLCLTGWTREWKRYREVEGLLNSRMDMGLCGGRDAGAGREAGVPARVIAEVLAGCGLDVRCYAHEDSQHLTVTGAGGGRCEIDVGGGTEVACEYYPCAGRSPVPADVSGVVLRLLGADGAAPDGLDTRLRSSASLKGAVAAEMLQWGLRADLEVYPDYERFDVVAEVVMVNPARPERGLVRATDDGVVRWECDYGDLPEGAVAVADTAAGVLAGAVPAAGGSGI